MSAVPFSLGFMDDSGVLWPMPRGTESHPSTVFRLRAGGAERLGDRWCLGELSRLVPQLLEAARRLERGERALVRSAVDDELHVPYLMLEPAGEEVLVSVFLIREPSVRHLYPAPVGDAGSSERLYAYVEAEREHLLSAADEDTFRELPLPLQPLVDAMRDACGARSFFFRFRTGGTLADQRERPAAAVLGFRPSGAPQESGDALVTGGLLPLFGEKIPATWRCSESDGGLLHSVELDEEACRDLAREVGRDALREEIGLVAAQLAEISAREVVLSS